MLFSKEIQYNKVQFRNEVDLEKAVLYVEDELFGIDRIYLDVKKKIGKKGKKNNIPDGYLIDLTSNKNPKLYVVENELIKHDIIRHISLQILEFSLSFESSLLKVKSILKEAIINSDISNKKFTNYAKLNGYGNIDFLLEKILYKDEAFNVLVIIDDTSEDLEEILIRKFQFPVEIITLEKYVSNTGKELYNFTPFLDDLDTKYINFNAKSIKGSYIPDPVDFDTIVVPARNEGFEDVFLREDCWYAVSIHSSIIPQLKYIASYRVKPVSAITHVAEIASIKPWKDTNKYIIRFNSAAKSIKPIKLVSKGLVRAPQRARYAIYGNLKNAKNLDDVFIKQTD